MSTVSESTEKNSFWLLSAVAWCFEKLFTDSAKKDKPEEHAEIGQLISGLQKGEKDEVLSNLRAEYREVSAYSMHYSNARTALAVFFLGSSHIFLFTQLQKAELSLIILFGPFLMIMGYGIHFQLTRVMQSALRKLVQVEYILNFNLKKNYNKKLMESYFSSWAGKLANGKSRAYDAVSEKFSIFYLIFAIFYLVSFFIGISVHHYLVPQHIVSIQPNITYQFDGKIKIALEEESSN